MRRHSLLPVSENRHPRSHYPKSFPEIHVRKGEIAIATLAYPAIARPGFQGMAVAR
jgi:hypothetical protein